MEVPNVFEGILSGTRKDVRQSRAQTFMRTKGIAGVKNSCESPRSSAEAALNCFPLSFRMYSYRLLTVLAIVLPIFSISVAHGFENADCLSCHGEQGIKTMPAGDRLAMVKPLKPGERRLETQAYVEGLYVNPEAYQQ